jgi:hypothetical protein
VILCLDRYPISAQEVMILDILNTLLSFLFLLEMIIRLIGLGIVEYCRDAANFLDTFVVAISVVDVSIDFLST